MMQNREFGKEVRNANESPELGRMPGRSPMSEVDYETTLRPWAEDTPWDRLRTSDFGPTCGDRPLIFGLCISAWAEDDLAIGFGHRTSARHAATDH